MTNHITYSMTHKLAHLRYLPEKNLKIIIQYNKLCKQKVDKEKERLITNKTKKKQDGK